MASLPGERITVGLVRGLHGLHGAVRVEVLSDDPSRFAVGSVVYSEGDSRRLTVAWEQPSKPGVLVRFEEATSRDAVEVLRGRYLEAVPVESLPEGSWYWHQVQGLKVTSTTGESLGTVTEVMRIGESEVYVVRGGPRREILVPAVRSFIAELAPAEGRMIVDAGALGLPADPPAPRPPRPQRPPRSVRTRRVRSARTRRAKKKS